MATSKLVKEMALKEQETEICIFCKGKEDREYIFGKFHSSGVKLRAHYHCLYFSSSLEQKGKNHQDVHGFLSEDILKEVKRGMGIKCHKCGTTGATVDCCNTKCKRTYHFRCGTESGMLNQYCGAFNSFCIDHRPTQKVPKCFLKDLPVTCIICNEIVIGKPNYDVLWAPCCKENWCHHDCIQRLALISADDIMKCPICFDKKIFIKEIKRMGIYIPDHGEQVFWELPLDLEPFTLECIQCNHPTCICPKGRTHDDSEKGDWTLMICSSCDCVKSLHIRCGNLDPEKSEWNCKDCSEVVGKSSSQSRRRRDFSSTGFETPSSSAALKRPRRGELGYPAYYSSAKPVNAAKESEVEFVPTNSPPSSCSQSVRYEPKPASSAGGAQCSPQQGRVPTQRKSRPVEKAPIHSSSSTSTPAEITTCSTGPCEAAANSALVWPVGGMNTSGSQNLPLTPAIWESFPEKVDCSTETTALQEMDGGNGPTNSEEQGAAEVNQQQQGRVPANSEKEVVENQAPPIIPNPTDLTRMEYPQRLVEVGELNYQGFTIKIFKNGTFDKFFFEPIVVLDQKSAVIQSQKLFKEDVVRFSILIWTQEIRTKVLERLRLKNIQVDEDDVRVMPFDSVQLIAKLGSIHQSVKVMGEAISYKRLNEKLDFFFLCDSPSTAEDLADNLLDSPDYLVRKWQLSLECRGLALNPSVSEDKTSTNDRPYSNPVFFPFCCSYPVKCM